MNSLPIRVAFGLIAFILHPSPFTLAQGTLTPPGAPAPTMKTLDQVEPRIAINATNTPGDTDSLFKITQPGSYYLTGNITGVAGKSGIEIAVATNGPGVTIDLMGFELAGALGTLDGIATTVPGTRNTAIRNGTVRAWSGDGIDLSNSRNNRLADLRAQGNGGSGMATGDSTSITNCTVQSNGSTGIFAFGGSTVTGCTAQSNTGHGIFAVNGSTVTGCTANFNTGDGFNASNGSTVTGCTTYENGGDGIAVTNRCTVTGCTSSINTLNGIRIGSNSRVTDNTCDANGFGPGLFSGIFTLGDHNRIEGNHVTNNDFGIGVNGDGHLIIRNYAGANTTNYSLPPSGSFVGTIVGTSAAMNDATNANINISN